MLLLKQQIMHKIYRKFFKIQKKNLNFLFSYIFVKKYENQSVLNIDFIGI